MENKESEENKTKNEEQEPINEEFLKNFDQKYKLIKTWIINPKSITMGELFGEENEESYL